MEELRKSRLARMIIWTVALTISYFTVGFEFVVVMALALILAE